MTNYSIKRYVTKTLKLEGYQRDYRLTKLPTYLDQVLIGLILADGGLERPSLNGGARLSVILSADSLPYVLHLYNLFEPYIDTDVSILEVKLNDKLFSTARFKTITTPTFLNYYNIFYTNSLAEPKASLIDNSKRVKIVPAPH